MTTKLIQVVLPLSVIGLAGVCWLGIYNAATTGDPLTMPYQLHDARYSASSLFIWQTPPPIPEYDHQRLQDYFVGVARERQLSLREPAVYLNAMSMKLYLLWDFFPLGLGLGLLSIPSLWNDRWMRLSILTGGVVLAIQTQLATTWIFPHYLAPLAAVFYAVNLNGLRCLAVWKRDRKTGRIIVRAIAIALLVELGFTLVVWSQPLPEHPRERVLTRLSEFEDSKHLVLVSYKSGHSVHDEYVYNQADIDAARVVWARDLGAEKNGRLLQHFSDRMIWRWTLEADDNEILEIIPPADHGYPREPAGVLVGTEIESEIDPHPCGRTR